MRLSDEDLISETLEGVTTKREKVTMNKIHNTSQAWLEDALHQAHDKIDLLTGGQFAFPKLEDIAITCGFPTTKARSVEKKGKSSHDWSLQGGHIISISPTLVDPVAVMFEVVVSLAKSSVALGMIANTNGVTHIPNPDHNGTHLAVNCRDVARIIRFIGADTSKPSQPILDTSFKDIWSDLIESFGKYPNDKSHQLKGSKKDTTRLIIGTCNSCGYKTYTVLTHLSKALPVCPDNHCSKHGLPFSYQDSRVFDIYPNCHQ